MERDLELRLKGHLYEIDSVNREVLDSRQGYPSSEKGYKRTLESVASLAGEEQLDDVAFYIKDFIRNEQERPTNQNVRRKARKLVSEAGYALDSYLNAA